MVEGVELKDFVEHDINQYDWAIRGCKAGQAPRKVQNVYYTNPQYPEFLRSKYQAIEDNEQRWESVPGGGRRRGARGLRHQLPHLEGSGEHGPRRRASNSA